MVCEPAAFPVQVARICEGESTAELGAAPQLVFLFSSGREEVSRCFLVGFVTETLESRHLKVKVTKSRGGAAVNHVYTQVSAVIGSFLSQHPAR